MSTRKSRIDKFYKLAKEQGFRARSAFKLLELNKKFRFLESSTRTLDLCCAPGSWLQVCVSRQPPGSTIVGFDLVSVRPINGCKSHVMDITTECCDILIGDIFTDGIDVVLCDGAPNMGAAWDTDAYMQNELTLSAMRLAAKHLSIGGTFVSKVFRSSNYFSLVSLLQGMFERAEVTKPLSSRGESAEIFVVCLGFLGYKEEYEELLQPERVFPVNVKQTLSLNDIYYKNIHRRDGYETMKLVKTITFCEFLKGHNLICDLAKSNKVDFDGCESLFDQETVDAANDLKQQSIYTLKKILKKRDNFLAKLRQLKLVGCSNISEKLGISENTLGLAVIKDILASIVIQCEPVQVVETDHTTWKLDDIKQRLLKRSSNVSAVPTAKPRVSHKNMFILPDIEFFEDNLFKTIESNKCIEYDDALSDSNSTTGENDSDTESMDFTFAELDKLVEMKEDHPNFIENSIGKRMNPPVDRLPDFYRDYIEKNGTLPEHSAQIKPKEMRKEIESKYRRERNLKLKLDKLKKKGIEEFETKKQTVIGKMKKKQKEVTYVAPSKGMSIIPRCRGRIRLVDRRLKKDLKAQKFAARRR